MASIYDKTPDIVVNDHYVGARIGSALPDASNPSDKDGYNTIRENEWLGSPLPDALRATPPRIISVKVSEGVFTIKHRIIRGQYRLMVNGKEEAKGTNGTFTFSAKEPFTDYTFLVVNDADLESEPVTKNSSFVHVAPKVLKATEIKEKGATFTWTNPSKVLEYTHYYTPATIKVVEDTSGKVILEERLEKVIPASFGVINGFKPNTGYTCTLTYWGCNVDAKVKFTTEAEVTIPPVEPPEESK